MDHVAQNKSLISTQAGNSFCSFLQAKGKRYASNCDILCDCRLFFLKSRTFRNNCYPTRTNSRETFLEHNLFGVKYSCWVVLVETNYLTQSY